MTTEVKAKVTLQEKIILKGKGHSDHEVQIDYIPPLGEGNGFMPMELLLTSLAGCSCHTVLFLLKNMDKEVEEFEVTALGQRRDEHPTKFTSIELNFFLSGACLDSNSAKKAIQMSEETYCPVWSMLKQSVDISWAFEVKK